MSLNVLIAPDKFKGTLTAPAAAAAIACGWRKARPKDTLKLLPTSDGGDGFGDALSRLLGAKKVAIKTVDAAHRPLRAYWWWEPKSKTAIIESANVIGLALLPSKKFHPFQLDTFGLGAVIRAAAAKGAKRCFIGIGGSATNDGGFGVARALGWTFLDASKKGVEEWTQLDQVTTAIPPRRRKWFEDFIVAVDVQNPLLGLQGCSRIYGPQKGLVSQDFPFAESRLLELAKLGARAKSSGKTSAADGSRKFANEPGAGAAGGLGFGLRCFAGARLQPGFDLFARKADLQRRLRRADLVITGEGSIDPSTAMGKGVGEIAARCLKMKIPCIGLAGVVVPNPGSKKRLFTLAQGLVEITSPEEAKRDAAIWLERLSTTVAAEWR